MIRTLIPGGDRGRSTTQACCSLLTVALFTLLLVSCGSNESQSCGAFYTGQPGGEVPIVFETDRSADPGDILAFRWDIPDGSFVYSQGGGTVECWTGSSWMPAWHLANMHRQNGEPFAIALSDGYAVAEAFYVTGAEIATPGDAAFGSYRLEFPIEVCEQRSRANCQARAGDVHFDLGATD